MISSEKKTKTGTTTKTENKVYHYDLRGSVIAITNLSGAKTAEYVYSTYGTRITVLGSDTEIMGYCGRDGVLTDPNSLIYMRARYYSSVIRRFINEDIIVGDIANSNSLNRYTYVEGNPVTMVDPFGLCVKKAYNSVKSVLEDENFQKVLIGTGCIIIGTTIVVASGGTATPLLIAMGAGVAGTTATGAVIGYCDNGIQGAIDGACTGYEIGGMLTPLIATGGLAIEAELAADFAAAYGGTSVVEGASYINTTQLYRVMCDEECNSLLENNKFEYYAKAMEDKWFTISDNLAEQWANLFYSDGKYRMVEVGVKTETLEDMYYCEFLDGIGPAYCATQELINNAMMYVKEVIR